MSEPSPKQTLILWALLGQGGTAAQSKLGFKPDAKDRAALQKAGLIAVQKGRLGAINLEATDRGWSWAGEHLGAALPSGRGATKAGTSVLQAWLQRLQGYLNSSGVALAEILATESRSADSGSGVPEHPRAPPSSYPELREQVRSAYRSLTGGRFNDSVSLSRLRRSLSELERSAFDQVVKRMHEEDDGTTLMNLGNPREIEAERGAAIRIKGQDMHVLWITR